MIIKTEPKCDCGETSATHDKETISLHHYWYFHKGFMDGCKPCEDQKKWQEDYFGKKPLYSV